MKNCGLFDVFYVEIDNGEHTEEGDVNCQGTEVGDQSAVGDVGQP